MKPSPYRSAKIWFAISLVGYGSVCLLAILYPLIPLTYPYMYEGLYWFCQSALIGAIADWFAVEALFRRPLGIKYHTAILPRKKGLIVNQVTHLVERFLLKKEILLAKIESLSICNYIDKIMASEKGRHLLGKGLSSALYHMNKEEMTVLFLEKLRQGLLSVQMTIYVASWLHKKGFSFFLEKGISLLEENKVEQMLKDEIDRYIESRPWGQSGFLWLGAMMNIVNTQDMAHALHTSLQSFLKRAAADTNSSEYIFLENHWAKLMGSFREEGTGRDIIEEAYKEWVVNLPLEEIWRAYVAPVVDRYVERGDEGISEGGLFLEEKIHKLWVTYGEKDDFRTSIEVTGKKVLAALADANHSLVGKIVREVLEEFDEAKFSRFIEDKFGKDLCFIRLNGTLVGALLGVILWLFMSLYGWILQSL